MTMEILYLLFFFLYMYDIFLIVRNSHIIDSNFCSLEINSADVGQYETNGITSTSVFCNIYKNQKPQNIRFLFTSSNAYPTNSDREKS